MIAAAWPWGLALATTAVVPLVLHLLHRTRWHPVAWPAMRLLRDVATRRGARLALQDVLLLILRMLLLTTIAITVARLQWREPSPPDLRSGRVAGVVLVDDGLPSGALAAQDRPLLDRQKELGLAYLGALAPGDEVSIIAGSQIGQPAADPGTVPMADMQGSGTVHRHAVGIATAARSVRFRQRRTSRSTARRGGRTCRR